MLHGEILGEGLFYIHLITAPVQTVRRRIDRKARQEYPENGIHRVALIGLDRGSWRTGRPYQWNALMAHGAKDVNIETFFSMS